MRDDHPRTHAGPVHAGACRSWRFALRPSIAIVTLLLLASIALAPPPVLAADGEAEFLDTSADADFPESLTFYLEATAKDPIEQVELFWHAADDPALSIAFPDFELDTHVTVEHEIDMAIHYLPPGVDIEYFWRVTERDGDISDSAPQTFLYMDERHDWQRLTDGLVTIYWYAGNEDFARDIVDTANRTIDILRDRFQVEAHEPIRIVIYGNYDDFGEALPPNSAEWIGGQAHPGLRLIVAGLQPGRSADAEVRRMIPHEVSHLIVDQATSNPFNSPPNWLDEGLAVYNQETEDGRFAELLDDAIDNGRLIPVRALNSSFPLDPDEALLSYAESASIVTYIIAAYGDDRLGALLNAFKLEMSYDEAVEHTLGITIEQLDAAWKAWLGYSEDRTATSTGDQRDDNAAASGMSNDEAVAVGVALGIAGFLAALGIAVVVLLVRRGPKSLTGT